MIIKSRYRLLLVGAGSLARELASWMKLDSAESLDYEFGGFISDKLDSLTDYPAYPLGVVSSVSAYAPLPQDRLVMAIADPRVKIKLSLELEQRGAQFVRFIHHTVLLSNNVQLGRGVVICPNVIISCDSVLGAFVTVNIGSTVGHDAKIGMGSTLSAHVDVTGFVQLDAGVFLGSHASILPHAKVGAYAKVGAGSVVLKSVRPGVSVMGVPSIQISP